MTEDGKQREGGRNGQIRSAGSECHTVVKRVWGEMGVRSREGSKMQIRYNQGSKKLYKCEQSKVRRVLQKGSTRESKPKQSPTNQILKRPNVHDSNGQR